MDLDPSVEFDTLSIREILDQDSRPTLVIDLDPDQDIHDLAHPIQPVFCNSALRLHEKLYDAVLGNEPFKPLSPDDNTTFEEFCSWATGSTPHDDSKDVFPLSFLFQNILWTGSTVRQRWRLISGNLLWSINAPVGDLSEGPPSEKSTGGLHAEKASSRRPRISKPLPGNTPATLPGTLPDSVVGLRTGSSTLVSSKSPPAADSNNEVTVSGSSESTKDSNQSKGSIVLSAPEKAVPDWTVDKPNGLLSEHQIFARSINWESTPLGPMSKWTPEFRQVANLLMSNPHPAALFWGSDLTMLYNEAYAAEVAGNKHPSLMGTGFSGPFSELWDGVSPIFAECARTGISVRKENDHLPIERFGLLEETFYSWSFTPLYGGTGRILGFYNAPFETTKQELSHRRMQTINKIGELTSQAKSVKGFWRQLLMGLESNHNDVPFAILYSVGDSEDADHSSMSSETSIPLKSCYFEGSIAVPEGHVAAPQQLDLKRSREGFVPSFREAMRTREPTLLRTRDGTLPEALLEGICWRGFGDPCHEAIIFPIRPTTGDMVLAFLLIGVNPRRPYDAEYKSFTTMLNRQLATSLASVMLYEDEVRRAREAAEIAAMQREQLTQQLAIQKDRMSRMTEISPLGMFLLTPDGALSEANDRFFKMTGLSKETLYEKSWVNCVTQSSTERLDDCWHRLLVQHLPWSGELQLEKSNETHKFMNGEPIDYWVMFNSQPELGPDNSVRAIMCSITDISHLKWAQGLQDRRILEAEETRRQQNEFIDITSHEMRNPLSAILQCAEDISSALEEYQRKNADPPLEVMESCIDAAHTISLCVQHQKSIVDEILTISKLDSGLLVITPTPTQPISIINRTVKMFELQLQAKDIKILYLMHPSLEDLGVDWVTLDSSRVLQILINLMTNAIKFTADAEKRNITISVGASLEPPILVHTRDFEYIPVKNRNPNVASGGDWGDGETLYIRFKIQDTGCGLTKEQKQILFSRFQQASPRTHAQYGGSGLGLFISRQLAELHGGQIGVASEAGVGSIFGFFIQAKRSDAPRRDSGGSTEDVEPPPPVVIGRLDVPQRQESSRSEKPKLAFDPKDIDILVVEDNLINQKVLVKQLKKVGIGVAVANDGVEALAYLETTDYYKEGGSSLSVILMDLEMPVMDGLTAVREIRKMEQEGKLRRRVPVIAVTANVRDQQVIAAKSSGMDDVVSKPFRMVELFEKIDQVLNNTSSGGDTSSGVSGEVMGTTIA
jgi:PAS domain S-box-containing protein